MSLEFWKKENKGGGEKVLKDIIAENSLNLAKYISLQCQEAEKHPK